MDKINLEQLEEMQKYFMEPGFSILVEYGWNDKEAFSQLIDTKDTKTIDAVNVTGSRIPRTQSENASPIYTVNKEAIEKKVVKLFASIKNGCITFV